MPNTRPHSTPHTSFLETSPALPFCLSSFMLKPKNFVDASFWITLMNLLVQQWHDCMYSDSKRGKSESATSVCLLLMGVTTAAFDPHPTVTHSRIDTHRMGRMNESFFSLNLHCTAFLWCVNLFELLRRSKWGACELEVSVCVCVREL